MKKGILNNFGLVMISALFSASAFAEVKSVICTSDHRASGEDAVQIRVIRKAVNPQGADPLLELLYDISYAQTASQNVNISQVPGTPLVSDQLCKFKAEDQRIAECSDPVIFGEMDVIFTTSKTEYFNSSKDQLIASFSNLASSRTIPAEIKQRLRDSVNPRDLTLKFYLNNVGVSCVVTNGN